MKLSAKRRPQSVLCLSVIDGQLRAAQVARARNAVAVLHSTTAPMALDMLHPEPELVGRELRNHLEAAQIRERHCVVALPPAWVMSQHAAVPELSPEDTSSLLQIEAEKGFPCSPEELQIVSSEHRSATERYVTQLAVRKEQLAQLGEVLKQAGLRPIGYSLGLAALPGVLAPKGEGTLALQVEPKGATLLVSAGGGIAAWRSLEASIESEAGENVANAAALARELRITFEQIPASLRGEVRRLAVCGDPRLTAQLAGGLGDWARNLGLTLEVAPAGAKPAAEEMIERLGELYLGEKAPALEFMPPHPGRWALLMARYNSRRLATVGFGAAAAALAVAAAFGWQEYRLWSLRSEWRGMAGQVAELEQVQARIREFRPWYDTSFRNLSILKKVVECFPETGLVSAKSFEIHSPAAVSVSGSARDNTSLLRTLDQLRQTKEVQGLKIEQIRGKTPAQFTFSFRWVGTPGT